MEISHVLTNVATFVKTWVGGRHAGLGSGGLEPGGVALAFEGLVARGGWDVSVTGIDGVGGDFGCAEVEVEWMRGDLATMRGHSATMRGDSEIARGVADMRRLEAAVARGVANMRRLETKMRRGLAEMRRARSDIARDDSEVMRGDPDIARGEAEMLRDDAGIQLNSGGGEVAEVARMRDRTSRLRALSEGVAVCMGCTFQG